MGDGGIGICDAVVESAGVVAHELLYIPWGGEIGGVDDRHISAHTRYLLRPPQGEGVVVAVGEEYGVGFEGVEEVGCVVAYSGAMAAVVVVVVDCEHPCGEQEREPGEHAAKGPWGAHAQGPGESGTYPCGVGPERTEEGVVALTGFAG